MTYLIEPKLFAANMRYFREKQTYTVKDVAQLSNLTVGVIVELERGLTVPTSSQLADIAAALTVKQTDLILPRPPEIEYYESC